MDEILYYIKSDIEKKYNISDPRFEIKNRLVDDKKEVIEWVVNARRNEKWIKYKHISDNVFSLKEYFPCPPESLCHKKIDCAIKSIKKWCASPKKLYFEFGEALYNEEEIKREMLFECRLGNWEIAYSGPEYNKQLDGYVLKKVYFYKDTEYGRTIPQGFIPLEQK